MATAVRGILSASALLIAASLAIATTALAQTPTKSLKDQLVGHWQLVSVSINGSEPYGDAPQGSMFLDAGGHYAVVVITGGAARSIAYFGTYSVNDADSSITMHIDASSGADAAGRDETRFVAFSGNLLTISNRQSAGSVGGLKLTWKQAN